MSELDLLPTEDEETLRTTVAGFLAKRCDTDSVRRMYDGDRSAAEPLWRGLAQELGLAGLLVPEDLGGAGASAREAAVVLEQVGGAVAPVPFLTSAVIATTVLLAQEATDAGRDLLARLASGERTAALAVPFSAPTCPPAAQRVTSVAGALEADVLLVPVARDGGVAVLAVEASAATVEPVSSLDMSRQLADVTVDAERGELVVPATSGAQAVDRALLTGAGLLASEQVGVAAWCLLATVTYLKDAGSSAGWWAASRRSSIGSPTSTSPSSRPTARPATRRRRSPPVTPTAPSRSISPPPTAAMRRSSPRRRPSSCTGGSG